MAYNFGEVLAQQAQQNVALQAQNRQNTMAMIQQLQQQAMANQERMAMFQQRERELDLQSRIQAFQQARALKQDEMEERRLRMEEGLNSFREKLLSSQATAAEKQGKLYEAQAMDERSLAQTRAQRESMVGAAGVFETTRKAYAKMDEQDGIVLGDLERKYADAEARLADAKDTWGWTSKSDRKDIEAAQKEYDALGAKLQAVRERIKAREVDLLKRVEGFNAKYGVTPDMAVSTQAQTGAAPTTQRSSAGAILDDL